MRRGQLRVLQCIIALAVMALWTGPIAVGADQPVVFATVVIGSHSGIRARANRVAKTDAQWRTLWQEHAAGSKPRPPRPVVDLTDEMVIAVFAGPSPARTRIDIEAITIQKNQLTVLVRTAFDPTKREFNLPEPDTPYHIVRLPRSSLRVVFVNR